MDSRRDGTLPSFVPPRLGNSFQSALDEDDPLSLDSLPDFGIEVEQSEDKPYNTQVGTLKIGLIDCHQLSQECLRNALESRVPGLTVHPFSTLQECLTKNSGDFDLFIYFWHANEASAMTAMQSVSQAAAALGEVPLVVLSDSEEAPHPKTVRTTLKSGARGFIPTRTTGIQMTAAAIRFVRAGGTFAPLDLLLSSRQERGPALPEVARKHRLTSRQAVVLSHLQQGKANKIIAHELSMSESTVKVHVRNIMRKMGATNRTQAVYKAQKLWDTAEIANMSEL
jgi:DNA-binding NarL/FixJ family response regulator